MYKNAEQMLNQELNPKACVSIYEGLMNAESVYKEFALSRPDFFNSRHINSIQGRIFGFLVNRQFEPDILPEISGLKVGIKKTNAFGSTISEIRCNDLILLPCKVPHKDSMPSRAKYKEKYSALNLFLEKQLLYEVDEPQDIKLKEEPYFAFVCYEAHAGSIKGANIVVPNKDMTGSLFSIDLTDMIKGLGNTSWSKPIKQEYQRKNPTLRNELEQRAAILMNS